MSNTPTTANKPGVDFLTDIRDSPGLLNGRVPDRDTGDHILNPDMGPYAYWRKPPREAAVLIPIVEKRDEPTVIFTVRTAHLSSHAGQVAFPGGKIDKEDGGPTAAALREAEEEIGLVRGAARPLGALPPYLTGSGYRVVPVVAEVAPDFQIVPNPYEVDDVFEVPLAFLMNPENHQKCSRIFNGQDRYFYAMPFGERYIWGVTAGIVRSLYETVYC